MLDSVKTRSELCGARLISGKVGRVQDWTCLESLTYTKRDLGHYVGCVEEEYDEENFNVRYLRNEVDNVFVYPDREDLDTIHHRVIESVLPFPKLIIPFMGTSLRGGKYVFEGVTFPKTVV